jgi:hypothetical protein
MLTRRVVPDEAVEMRDTACYTLRPSAVADHRHDSEITLCATRLHEFFFSANSWQCTH